LVLSPSLHRFPRRKICHLAHWSFYGTPHGIERHQRVAAGSGPLLGFIETLAAAGISGSEISDAATISQIALNDRRKQSGRHAYRKLGRTGEEVSLIGVGGFHIGSVKDESEAIKIVRTAIDKGVTFMDNCWTITMGERTSDGEGDEGRLPRQSVFNDEN